MWTQNPKPDRVTHPNFHFEVNRVHTWNMLCDESPLLGPVLFYEVDHKLVFFLCPGHLLGLLSLRALNQLLGSSQYVAILSCIALIRDHHLQLLLLIVFLLLRFIIGVFGLAAVR